MGVKEGGGGEFHLKGVGGSSSPAPCSSGAEFLGATKAPKKTFGANQVAPDKHFEWPKARSKIWPNHLRGGSEGGGWVASPQPPPPPPPLVLSRSVELWGGGA